MSPLSRKNMNPIPAPKPQTAVEASPTLASEAQPHNPVPPEGCSCASFWTVRGAHKRDCPLAASDEQIEDVPANLPFPVDCDKCVELRKKYPDMPNPTPYYQHYQFHGPRKTMLDEQEKAFLEAITSYGIACTGSAPKEIGRQLDNVMALLTAYGAERYQSGQRDELERQLTSLYKLPPTYDAEGLIKLLNRHIKALDERLAQLDNEAGRGE